MRTFNIRLKEILNTCYRTELIEGLVTWRFGYESQLISVYSVIG